MRVCVCTVCLSLLKLALSRNGLEEVKEEKKTFSLSLSLSLSPSIYLSIYKQKVNAQYNLATFRKSLNPVNQLYQEKPKGEISLPRKFSSYIFFCLRLNDSNTTTAPDITVGLTRSTEKRKENDNT